MSIDVYKEWLGIPEGPRPPDHYQLLRLVQFEDSVEKIRTNYRKLNTHVRKYATGKYSIESQDLLNELAKAMLCLTDAERKRDYDVGLGREIEDEGAIPGRKPMEVLLVQQDQITEGQMQEAREYADKTGLSIRDALVQLKTIPPDIAAQALAQELGLPYLDLADMIPDDTVLDRVPRRLVKQHSILPLFVDDDVLLIACTDQPTQELEEELTLRFDLPVRAVLATPLAINQGIAKYYAPGAREEVADDVSSSGKKGQKGKSKSASAPTPQRKPKTELSPEDIRQQKMIAIVGMCWCVIVPVAIDQFLLPRTWLIPYVGLTALFIPPIGIFTLWKLYLSK